MLAQVARQILHSLIKLKELPDARMRNIETGIAKLSLAGVFRILPFPGMNETREMCQRIVVKIERLADFARRRAPAISDDVRRHRGPQLSVALVNVLNRFLALLSARQVEIDVRPFASFLRKEPLEQQVHADGIDGRYAQ